MEIYTSYVTATRAGAAFPGAAFPGAAFPGAAFPGASSAWTSVAGAGENHARTQNPVLAAVRPDARCAFRSLPAPSMQFALVTAELPAVNGIRKQTNHKTRITAGGYGAMGPHPEREPA